MTLTVVRTALKDAVAAALNDDSWLGTATIPETPDSPSFWVRFPNDARRNTMTAGLRYEIRVSFCVGLTDTEMAQQALNDVYEPDLWAAIEAYTVDPMPWEGVQMIRLDEPYQLTLADGSQMLAVDMPFDIYT